MQNVNEIEGKNKLLQLYQLTLENGWFWQKKENMSPWKVFSEVQFKNRTLLFLLFRIHKLCFAKLNYFSSTLEQWTSIRFKPNGIESTNNPTPEDFAHTEGFLNKKTGKFVTITKLQQITVKEEFIQLMEIISDEKIM